MWTKLKAQFLRRQSIGTIIIGVTGVVLALQWSGTLQLLESAVLDRWFRLRPLETGESRVIIVTIDEPDISRLGHWPMSDATLATLLEKLKQQQPTAIGLDFYRNLPVEPGHQELLKVFASTPNLIGIKKALSNASSPAVEPPPILQNRDQVAASDLVQDADGKVRRHLLSVRNRQGKTIMTLGTKLALAYLESKNIQPEVNGKDKTLIQMGKAKFRPLQENEGGYVRADVGGYQILSNFHKTRGGVPKISITDVLEDRIPANLMRGRIVLIGTVAASLNDNFYTPYTTNPHTFWSGVELHADLASQILSAALDGRQLLRGVPEPIEWFWVFLWSSVGTALGWRVRSPCWVVVVILAAGASLMGSAYLFFLGGWWVSAVSPFLSLVSAGLVSRGFVLWRQLQLSHQELKDYAQTLEAKVQERTQELGEKELFLRNIYDGVAESIFVVDVLEDGEFQYVGMNPAHEHLAGIQSSELQGKTPEQLFPPDAAAIVRQQYQTCIEAGETISYEECLPFQGQQTWWFTNLTPLRDKQERIYRIIGSSINITERKQAEAALQQAEEKYRSIFENADEGLFQTTPDGRYLSANPALARIYGYSDAEELIACLKNINQQLYVDKVRRAKFLALLQAQDRVSNFKSQVYRKDGSIIWVVENARIVRNAQGEPLYYEGSVVDITVRKVWEEALLYQQQCTDDLLYNILPVPIAQRLKLQESIIADSFDEVTVLFADLVNFTELSAQISATTLVDLLNKIFSVFDRLTQKHGLEKIKTIGDAYMVVGGLPTPRPDHAEAVVEMALDMQQEITRFKRHDGKPFHLRIGINTGSVVAGVIGTKKFAYDLWGDTVNVASRMESQGAAGGIQVTAATYELLKDKYVFEQRDAILVKGKGEMITYWLIGKKGAHPVSVKIRSGLWVSSEVKEFSEQRNPRSIER
ncbi:adenylate/guanylate cyclase domain-containing protein [Allocoleopsis franciscana]|uniref:Adenylate cyclase n=1 Tax=Allocoleopsis franciscana PCC 7113 TaxID=1173027 RepID=K9WMX1_9CYAN|nr:adenylate/guanylate cyclase domain-containing protein [Allocoleopsis franciscana]AFZ21760.1 PAS domain S-box [Allocoleopsis franciscana PCC 7113]